MTDELNKKKILIVDDDEDLRVVLLDKLNAAGFYTVGASDGEEGFSKALELHPDLILLDVLMPKMNGWQTLEKLREDEWGKSVKVIMLTVLDNSNYVAEALEKKVYGYIIKTDCKLDDVVAQVHSAVDDKN